MQPQAYARIPGTAEYAAAQQARWAEINRRAAGLDFTGTPDPLTAALTRVILQGTSLSAGQTVAEAERISHVVHQRRALGLTAPAASPEDVAGAPPLPREPEPRGGRSAKVAPFGD